MGGRIDDQDRAAILGGQVDAGAVRMHGDIRGAAQKHVSGGGGIEIGIDLVGKGVASVPLVKITGKIRGGS